MVFEASDVINRMVSRLFLLFVFGLNMSYGLTLQFLSCFADANRKYNVAWSQVISCKLCISPIFLNWYFLHFLANLIKIGTALATSSSCWLSVMEMGDTTVSGKRKKCWFEECVYASVFKWFISLSNEANIAVTIAALVCMFTQSAPLFSSPAMSHFPQAHASLRNSLDLPISIWICTCSCVLTNCLFLTCLSVMPFWIWLFKLPSRG